MRPSRRRPDPILMGQPSPSLAKINKMNMEELKERIASLETEKGHLSHKVEQLSQKEPRDEVKITELKALMSRLGALVNVAKERLEGKVERSQMPNFGKSHPPRGPRRF
ncbi:MAG: hypothetical protein IT440_14345 [Phycisphaeraceae bacterium]|nr:hypothetical protein [Phycisphaeraceae bacterium]